MPIKERIPTPADPLLFVAMIEERNTRNTGHRPFLTLYLNVFWVRKLQAKGVFAALRLAIISSKQFSKKPFANWFSVTFYHVGIDGGTRRRRHCKLNI